MTETPAPLVTIIIPCYNHGLYLAECLASLVAQTYPHWHAIVVDDASADIASIESVIQNATDPRIRLVRHTTNRGMSGARNTGFREAATELVLPVDADDRIEPDSLSALVACLQEDPSVDCAYGDVILFGRHAGLLQFSGPPAGKKLTRIQDTIPGAGTLMRRQLWEKLGGYDEHETLRHGREDFEFWLRAFKTGCKAMRVPQPLYHYRQLHTSMETQARLHEHEIVEYIYHKHQDNFETAAESRDFLARGYHHAALSWHLNGDQRQAFRLAFRAFRLWPSRVYLKSLLKTLLTYSQSRRLQDGELRRLIPFAGYPLHGRERHRPFFIIGVGRSGSTLFRRILASHSELYIPPETFVLGEAILKFQRYRTRMSWPDLVHFVLSLFEFHPEFYTFDLWLGPAVNQMIHAPAGRRNLAHLINGFYAAHARQHGFAYRRWGDKTPLNSLDDALAQGDMPRRIGSGTPQTLERLLKVFPDAQFIHIYRDGCDVVYSHIQGGFYKDIGEAALRWLHVVRQARNFVRKHPRQGLEIRYEDLITHPEITVRAVCDFLQIEFEPAMLTSEHIAAEMGDIPAWLVHKKVGEPIQQGNFGKGRQFFSEAERERLQGIIGEALRELGYPPAFPNA